MRSNQSSSLPCRNARAAARGLIAAATLAAAAAWPIPATATFVTGSFTMRAVDWVPGPTPLPPPFLIGTGSGIPDGGAFSYETNDVASAQLSPDGITGRYVFDHAASLSVTVGGLTYSTTASPSNPIAVLVQGNNRGSDTFRMGPAAALGAGGPSLDLPDAADPSNPLPAFAYMSMLFGSGTLPNGDLPTASFPGAQPIWMDPDLFLRSTVRPGPDVAWYRIRYILTSEVTISTIPVSEPSPLAPWSVGVIAVMLFAWRASTRHTPARSGAGREPTPTR
jgi:hypothetical protein